MSALPLKADMCSALAHVAFGPEADSCAAANLALTFRWSSSRDNQFETGEQQLVYVRSAPESKHFPKRLAGNLTILPRASHSDNVINFKPSFL
jgi:hypothetical protein